MNHETFTDGVLVETHDDTTRTVTTYDPQGNVTATRPYTADENASADAAADLTAGPESPGRPGTP